MLVSFLQWFLQCVSPPYLSAICNDAKRKPTVCSFIYCDTQVHKTHININTDNVAASVLGGVAFVFVCSLSSVCATNM